MSISSDAVESDRPVILVVDDNEDIQTVLMMSLEHHGFQAYGTTTGGEAIEILEAICPDIVLIDQGLPDTLGIEVGKRVRQHKNGRSARLFLFSGNFDTDLERRAKEAGFVDFFIKPIRMAELLERIQI